MVINKLKKMLTPGLKKQQPSRELSPFHNIGFHGDVYLLDLARHCLNRVDLFVETGTNVGSTLHYVGANFPNLRCYSCEPDKQAFAFAQDKVTQFSPINISNESSVEMLGRIVSEDPSICSSPTLFWLDAHGYGFEWPLKKELDFITNNFSSAYILIDDFRVPGRDYFNYDKYKDQICSYDFVKDALNPNITYHLYYPRYKDKTSPHHPLTGWGLLVYGDDNFVIPTHLTQKMERYL